MHCVDGEWFARPAKVHGILVPVSKQSLVLGELQPELAYKAKGTLLTKRDGPSLYLATGATPIERPN